MSRSVPTSVPESVALLRRVYPDSEARTGPDHLAELGGVIEAIPYRWLYWPELVESHGAVFVDLFGAGAAAFREGLDASVRRGPTGRSRTAWLAVVDSYNLIELWQLFRRWRGGLDASEEALLALGGLVLEPWRARLNSAFPDRMFTVEIVPPDPEVGVCLQVRQTAPRLDPPAGW